MYRSIFLVFIFICEIIAIFKHVKERGHQCKCGHGLGHPWHAKLYCNNTITGEMTSYCNAVLVSPWYVLTTRVAVTYGKL